MITQSSLSSQIDSSQNNLENRDLRIKTKPITPKISSNQSRKYKTILLPTLLIDEEFITEADNKGTRLHTKHIDICFSQNEGSFLPESILEPSDPMELSEGNHNEDDDYDIDKIMSGQEENQEEDEEEFTLRPYAVETSIGTFEINFNTLNKQPCMKAFMRCIGYSNYLLIVFNVKHRYYLGKI